VRRCSYCDFSIAVRKQVPAREYVDAVLEELRSARPADAGPLDSLYLGGGTPSLLPAEALTRLVTSLFDAFRSTPSFDDLEVTLEANPEDVTPENAMAWRAAGVNRVSLGGQSFDDRVLAWMHRSHGAARIGEACRVLRAAGIGNISLDLIFALPAELKRDWSRDLDLACELRPEHLSLYGLTVEERTPLARWISRGAAAPPDDDRYAAEYLLAHERLAAAGYRFYEVSNAAREGRRSRHNSAYWSGRPYLGLGPAAHSFDGRARRWNLGAWEAYRAALAAGRSPVESEEVLTPEQRELEGLYLALRTDVGVPRSACPPGRLSAWEGAGWVEVEEGRVRCTPEGWLRLEALVRDLTAMTSAS
jgi:putative oxygen-independent coproporphyrinogen III oxidase